MRRSYVIETGWNNCYEGFYCKCYSGSVLFEQRFFFGRDEAEDYGGDWINSKILAYG